MTSHDETWGNRALSSSPRRGNWPKILLLLLAAYIFRLLFGLCSEFWFIDEKQIYLLGLKFYTTGLWPYFGPDVVYTGSQIPGALQALLVGLPFYILKIPEAPYLLLNILSLASLSLLAWYCLKRTPDVPRWFIWTWLLTAPWTLNYSTHVLNTSYVLPAAVLFFIGVLETIPFLSKNVIAPRSANLMMGFSLLWIYQLHMSWTILIPFVLGSFFYQFKAERQRFLGRFGCFAAGALVSGSLALPTFIKYGLTAGGTGANVRFHPENLKNIFTVLARFLSFAGFELPRFLGADTANRIAFFKQNPWLIPIGLFVGIIGIIQPLILAILWFAKKDPHKDWPGIKSLVLFTFGLVYLSFIFSVKEPASHTFLVVLPVAMIYSFYVWGRFLGRKLWSTAAAVFLVSGIIFHIGLAVYRAPRQSLYKDRATVMSALEKKDYTILGERRKGFY
jgi:hypothetical protein